MIQVYKRKKAPEELASKGYKCDEVKEAILKDQHDKCYLCERKMTTDYQVEHLASQKHYANLTDEWNNLFMACNYCNDRKKHYYDDLPSPASLPFEELILHTVDEEKQKASFSNQQANDERLKRTAQLLEKLYNGKGNIRNLMEKRFWDVFHDLYLDYMRHINDYLQHPTDDNKRLIENDLNVSQPILAFKYAVIKRNSTLWAAFAPLCKWNKD